MNYIDVLIVIFAISAAFRGKQIGFVRQFFSTVGFFIGLLLGAWLQPHTSHFVHSQLSKSVITLITTLGLGLAFMSLGEYGGIKLKQRLQHNDANKFDNAFGSVLAVVSTLLIVWLSANIFTSLPANSFGAAITDSKIVSTLTDHLPAAPGVIAQLNKLIDPNGFPQVFTGREPVPHTTNTTPTLAGFETAIANDKASVVKLEGQGCGGVVEGSGFIVGDGLVATNAHVVAGVTKEFVVDDNGTHRATPIWFDSDLDLAVVRVDNLAGKALSFNPSVQTDGTNAAVMGYPGGGAFNVGSAVILDEFIATGRNIYGEGKTARSVYEVNATIIPGNSGGPLIDRSGKVIGVVFAESTSYQNVGYALTAKKVISEVDSAKTRTATVSTGGCAE